MSIVKWSTVRIKTKDKLIITGQIEISIHAPTRGATIEVLNT